MALLWAIILISSFAILILSSNWLVSSLSKIAKLLGWKEFVVAFLFFAFLASLPNLFVGIISAFMKIPELSLGDVIGGNIIDLSIVAGICALISKAGISAPSRTVQNSALALIFFTLFFWVLASDKVISRGDAIFLLIGFFGYLLWLFEKKERFKKIYDSIEVKVSFKEFFKNLFLFLVSGFLLFLASQGVVLSAKFFSNYFNFPLWLIGILIVSWGNCLPELAFSIRCALKDQDWLILGDLIGSVIISTSLVLGTVALIHPIQIKNPQAILISRMFLLLISFFFFFLLRTGRKISRREGGFLIIVYFLFLILEIFLK